MTKNALFDQIASRYDQNRGGTARGERFAKAILPHLVPGGRVLEIGVGTGAVATAVEQAGFEMVGLDVSRGMLAIAADRIRTIVWADMNALPFIDGYFSNIYAVWALHLATDIEAMLREVRRVLRSGGRFVTSSAANPPSDDPIGAILWEMQRDLLEHEFERDSPARLSALAPATGFAFEQIAEISQSYETSPNAAAAHVAARDLSTLQTASASKLTDVVEPAIARLRALPDPDRPITRRTTHQLSILRAIH